MVEVILILPQYEENKHEIKIILTDKELKDLDRKAKAENKAIQQVIRNVIEFIIDL